MCKFFSLVSKGDGEAMYFDSENRKELKKDNPKNYEVDSHTSIADYFGYKGADEDKLNKYEYNPLTKKLVIDQLNTVNDSNKIKKFCNKLDFKTVIPELIIKKVIHPFEHIDRKRVSKKDIKLLKKWVKVYKNVGDSVVDSVGGSVRDTVEGSVDFRVRDAVGGSVYAYIGSFFNIDKWKYIKHKSGVYPFQSAVDLWDRGLVACTDGKIWYLCGGSGYKILWKGKV